MGKKSSKDRSVQAAEKQGELNRETARDTTYADRPDQYNPFGSLTWQQQVVTDPATGEPTTKWIQSQSLSPELQSIYGNQMSSNRALSDLSAGMMGRIRQEMGSAPDWAQFGDVHQMEYDPNTIRSAAEDAAYMKETMRLDPQFASMAEQTEIKLRQQGLRPGDQAYDAAMSTFNQGRNDAYEQARLGASATGRAEAGQLWGQQLQGTELANALRQQQIDEYLGKRQYSLGESQALNPTANLQDLASIYAGGDA